MLDPATDLASRAFTGVFRRYQKAALDALDRDRAAGDHRFHVVLPPGAGKTIVGLEAARRLGNRTLILAPNTAVQAQWAATWDRDFPPTTGRTRSPCGTDRRLTAPVTALTYQSIAVIDATADQRTGALRDGDTDALLGLLHPNGRAAIERASALGPWTLVLDECHHLLATWGALVRAVVDTLGTGTALVGLTATPRRALSGWQRDLHDDLFGAIDLEVLTPALVKERELAPYQELVYLTRPTAEEDTWLATESQRFTDLRFQLVDERLGSVPLIEWLRRRAADRATEEGARASWGAFEAAEPDLARAALRFAHVGLIPVPDGARVRERHRAEPDAEDWVAVLSDFCVNHLRHSDDPRDATALTAIRRALPSLGYRLTSRGVRASVSPVDRLCGLSEAKVAAATHILGTEDAALGPELRALVLCDFERASGRIPASLAAAPIDEYSGSARLVFTTLAAADVGGVGALRPLLVTGHTFACPTGLADELVEFCARAGHPVEVEPLEGSAHARRILGVRPRTWVRLATEFFAAGHARVMIGTRALLGEGWDCPALNVTVDLTTATTPGAITQMRGRSLRLDPDRPAKVANNWTVSCVTADHPRGDADYQRLVRKHDAYYALTAAGDIESGLTHCDPALTPYAVPPVPVAGQITARALDRSGARDAARTGWRLGEPYIGTETATVRVRSGRALGGSARALPAAALRPVPRRRPTPAGTTALGVLGGTGVAGTISGVAAGPLVGIGTGTGVLVLGGAALAATVARRSARLATASSAVEQLAAAVADGLRQINGVDRGADAVRVTPTPDGWLRCELTGVPTEQSRRFADALDELMAPLGEPRHLVGRRVVLVPPTRRGRAGLAARALVGLPVPGAVAWHAVPRWFAARPNRLRAFLTAWYRWVGPPKHLRADSPDGYAILELFRGEDPFSVVTQVRTLWR